MEEVSTPTLHALFRFAEHFLARQIRDMIRLHGLEESGAGNYYARRTTGGGLFPQAERDIFRSIMSLAARQPVNVVHAGNGLGTFSIMMALTGASVLGIDMGRERAWGARQLRGSLFELLPDVVARYECREGEFPNALREADVKPNCKNVLVFTNVGNAWSETLEKQIISTFLSFDVIYFCSSMFGSRGRTKEGCEGLMAMIASLVPGHFEKLNDISVYDGFYYILDRSQKATAAAG